MHTEPSLNPQTAQTPHAHPTALYLAESYRDAWDDYVRSVNNPAFPVWDYIVLTASNDHQAHSFRLQIENRRAFLPKRTRFLVLPDEGGVRVGSGGATLTVLKAIREREASFQGKRILVIHSGGDSKRVPQYSALGKLFSPVPHALPDGRVSTLFDEFLIAMSAVPSRIREGMLLLSGDVLLLFNPLLIDYSGHGAACISFKEDAQTGKNHGVFLRGEDGCVKSFLHKQTVEKLKAAGAVNESGKVDIDTGAVIFGTDVMDSLYSLISTDGAFDPKKYREMVNDTVRLSLYGDFQYPLASGSTLESFYNEAAEGERTPALDEAREKVWRALHGFPLKLLRLAPAKFIHFGTTREILALMSGGVDDYADLNWSRGVNCSMDDRASGYNAILSPNADVGEGCYLEVSYVHSGAAVGDGCVLSYIDVHAGEVIPSNTVLHGLKQSDGKFVCRIFGTMDDPKGNRLFGKPIPASLADSLWLAPIYPERGTIHEAVAAALDLYQKVMRGAWDEIERGKSLCAGFNDADPEAILAWDKRMAELVRMNAIEAAIHSNTPVSALPLLPGKLTKIQREWFTRKVSEAPMGSRMRLEYYVGRALRDDGLQTAAFGTLSDAILTAARETLKENQDAHMTLDTWEVKLPLRVNWGGGWSDTPPYCIEKGGTVLNAAIELNCDRPVTVGLTRLSEHKIIFESRDMDVHGEFETIEPLQSVGDPFDPFVLQKAALLACGVIPSLGGDLEAVLARLGGGLMMRTEVTGVPRGSGLGTSSILAAACVRALCEFLNIPHTEDDLYSRVLCMEQLMSTGGGWQDQVGGVTDGIKYITSRPGLKQSLKVEHVALDDDTMRELNDRFVLIYTGQRRLARNLLRDVVGRYIGNELEALTALNEIQRTAALMRFELERGNIDAFALLMDQHWTLSRQIDHGSTNTLIDQIFDSIADLIDGRMVCGAGGGGFLQAVLKRGVTKTQLEARLSEVFQDTDIRAWDCRLV